MKRFYFFAIVLVCSLAAKGQYTVTLDDIDYELSDSELTIIDYTNYDASKDIVIPEKMIVDGTEYAVTSIGYAAFKSKSLTKVSFPASLTSVGSEAFMSNQLTEIVFGENSTLQTIKSKAFAYNKFTSVSFPASLTSFGFSAFYKNQLTSLTIPKSVISLETYVFAGNALTSVVFEEGSQLEIIKEGVFSSNAGLGNITLPVVEGKYWKKNIADGPVTEIDDFNRPTYTLVEYTYYAVNIAVNGSGTLTATVDGSNINTGDNVQYWQTVVFSATPGEGYIVKQWTVNGSVVEGNTDVSYTHENLSEELNVIVEFEVATGIDDMDAGKSHFRVYPNPARGNVYVEHSDVDSYIDIYSFAGELVKQVATCGRETKIDLTGIKPGVYLIKVNSQIQKLVVK